MQVQVRQVFLFCAMVLLSGGVSADVYKWVDKHGRVHFTDKAPIGTKVDTIKIEEASEVEVAPSVNITKRQRQNIFDVLARERKEKDKLRQERREEKAKKQAACAKLKILMVESESINTYYRRNKKGERVFLSDQERKASDNRRQEKYQKECG
ncbi:MAG: hypothetical protein COA99_15970 [Moraxellaceae bacterium]|nr:MAG: hypothetical protein COA99_15970 [Moraxellaceae bacterium]